MPDLVRCNEPNSEALFCECYSQSILQILRYFGEETYIPAFCLLNQFDFYLDRPDFILGNAITSKDLAFLLSDAGLALQVRQKKQELIENMIQDLSLGHVIMAPLDCFYDAEQRYTFGRVHKKHHIVVLPESSEKKKVAVLRHDYINETGYYLDSLSTTQLRLLFSSDTPAWESVYYCFGKTDQHNGKNPIYGFGYVLYVISRYQKFLQWIDHVYHKYISFYKSEKCFFDFPRIARQIWLVKKRVSGYCEQHFPKGHFLCGRTERIAAAWQKLYEILHKLEQEKEERSVMRLQIYYEDIVWHEQQFILAVKNYYEQQMEV